MEEPIRILSDLHLGHTASLARDIEQIAPLYEGAHTVIFNGDTIEMRSERSRERAAEILHAVQAFCAAQSAATLFLNGNHDPIISTTNHLELAAGSLLVTHGDVLFPHEDDETFPQPRAMRRKWPAREREITARRSATMEQILATNKRHADALPIDEVTIPDGAWGQFTTFMKQTWPPRRFVHMVTSWRNTPQHAVNLVRAFRPDVCCIVVGHTHYPGVWHRHGYSVINTGSYLPVLGRLAVDFAHGKLTVRKVVMRRGRFHLGRTIAHFSLPAHVNARGH